MAGIINFMRNMGSSVGTSLVTTLIARRSQFHQQRLVQTCPVSTIQISVNAANGLTQHLASSGLGKHEAQAQAYARIYQPCKRRRRAWHTSIPLWFLPSERRSCFPGFCFEEERSRRWRAKGGGVMKSNVIRGSAKELAVTRVETRHSMPMIKIVTIEREYGSGGGEIAQLLAKQLGWKLWDQLLTEEIARLAECPKAVVEVREERTDPLYYRLFKSFLRGSYEGSLNAHKLKVVDSESILKITERVVQHAAKTGNSVIVGQGIAAFSQDPPRHIACVSLRPERR